MNHCRELVCVILATALSGCVRYEESIAVHKDGSGTAAIVLTRPDAPAERGTAQGALAALFDARFSEAAMKKRLPAGVVCEYRTAREDGKARAEIRYSFDSIQKFIAWAANSNSPFSNVSVAWKGRSLEYSRTFRPLDPEGLAAVRASLPDGELVFRFTGPGALGRTDATKRAGNTAVWEFRAPELLSGQTITAQYTSPALWPLYLAGLAALALLAAALALRRRKRRGRARSATS